MAEKKQTGFPKIDLKKEIIFGQSAFLSEGALQLYGELIRNAILAKFNSVNKKGGINGKILRLISFDDAGDPQKTFSNINLMKKNKIDMFLGLSGTRSILKILPLIRKKEIAVLFPWAGDEKLRQSNLSHLINGIGWIEPQIKSLTKYSLDRLRLNKIAIFHEDSSFGSTNKDTLVKELKKRNVTPVKIASYNRFTMNIKFPAEKLIETDPKVVISLATSMPTVKLINKFLELGHYGTKFIGIDSTMFVGNILQRKGVTFHYASPVPNPLKSDIPIVKEFKADMKEYFPNDTLNILSLSYYIHASIIVDALKNIVGPVTKEKLITQIEKMKNYDLGGFPIDFDNETRHAYKHKIRILKGKTPKMVIQTEKKGK